MKIKKYNKFVNEELSDDSKFILKNAPYILGNRFISNLLGAAPLLASKWKSLKSKTKGEYSYYGGGTPSKIKGDIKKIRIEELPDTPLKRGLYPLFNNWNIYSIGEKSTGGVSKGPERPVFYITKDDLKVGDNIYSTREGSWETEEIGKSPKGYIKHRDATEKDPIFVLVAKYDIDEFLHSDFKDELKSIINDNIEEFDITVDKIYTSLENDSITCELKGNYADLKLTNEVYNLLVDECKRACQVIKNDTGKPWKFSLTAYSGQNTIDTDVKWIIYDYYKSFKGEEYFWSNLRKFNILKDETREIREFRFKIKDDDEKYRNFAINDLISGKYQHIVFIKDNEKIITEINFDFNFDKITIYFKLEK